MFQTCDPVFFSQPATLRWGLALRSRVTVVTADIIALLYVACSNLRSFASLCTWLPRLWLDVFVFSLTESRVSHVAFRLISPPNY